MAALTLRHLYPGVPNTIRGESSRISLHPTEPKVAYPSGRVAIVRSLSDPLQSKTFALHSGSVTSARFSPCGTFVASSDDSGIIRIWNAETAAQKIEIDAMSAAIRDIAFSKEGKFIVAVGESRGAYGKVLKVQSGGSAGVCAGHTKRAVSVDVGGKMVATASEDMSVGLFKGPPVREIDVCRFLKHPQGFVNQVKFSSDAKYLAIGSSDRTATIASVETEEIIMTVTHGASVTGVEWIQEDSKLVTSSNDKTCCVWSVPDGQCIEKFTYGNHVMDMQTAVAVSKDNKLVSVSLRPEINILDLVTKEKCIFRGHSKQIVGLAAIGDMMYTADYSGLMVSWKLDKGSSNDIIFNGKGPATSVCAVAANAEIVANVGQDGKVYVTPRDTLTFRKATVVKGGGVGVAVGKTVGDVSAVMVNETRVAAISRDGDSIVAELEFERGEKGTCLAISTDLSLVAVGFEISGGSGELRFYTLANGTFTQQGERIRMPSAPNRIALSPDSSYIAVGEKSRRVKLYSMEDRRMTTGGGLMHSARVDAIAFSEDGCHFATGGMDGSVAVWKVGNDAAVAGVKTAHRNGVTGVAFIDGGIASSGGDGCVRTWDLK